MSTNPFAGTGPRITTVDDLVPDHDNANRGTERGLGLLEDILRRRGLIRSIGLDRDYNVVAGNQVLQAAVNAGIIRVKVVETDGNELVAIRRSDIVLDSEAGRELSLADNVIPTRSRDLDINVIQRQADQYGIELGSIGISDDELRVMLEEAAKAEAVAGEGELVDDSGAPAPEAPIDEEPVKVFLVEVACTDEMHQAEVMTRLAQQGLRVRPVTRIKGRQDG